MLDIKYIKENTQEVKKRLATRQDNFDTEIDNLVEMYNLRCALIAQTEAQKSKQNQTSRQIPKLKSEGKDVSEILGQMKELSDSIKKDNERINKIDSDIEELLLFIPNLPHESVPIGEDDSANVEIRRSGEIRKFDFTPLPHWEVGAKLKILDPEAAAKVTGTRFHFYKGAGAALERAIINYFLDTHSKKGYTEVFPPFMVNRESMQGTGQLPKFEEDAFKVSNNGYYLIPTAEVPVTNMHRNEILEGAELPLKYCAYSACFRAEAGTAGRDTRGLIRQHQFNKVELVKFCEPQDSYAELESLTSDAQEVLTELGLAHRVVCLSSGDLGFSSAKTYDIEVYMPSYDRFVEISSCSNFEDFQSRRAAIRYKNSAKEKARFVHTLNGSGVAVGRTVAAILENYQNADGSVTVPEVLRRYLGIDIITEP